MLRLQEVYWKHLGFTTQKDLARKAKSPIVLAEVDRVSFGGDKNAINRHSVRKYMTQAGVLFMIDRQTDCRPRSFQLYGPMSLDFRGICPGWKVGGHDYFGNDWSWSHAERVFVAELGATLMLPLDFLREYGKREESAASMESFTLCGVHFVSGFMSKAKTPHYFVTGHYQKGGHEHRFYTTHTPKQPNRKS